MTERKLSTLGYLMDRLGLSTAALARRLHVDASLVSKWRSGSRRLSAKSVYFDEVCRMLLEQNPMALTDALRSLVPLEEPKREEGERGKRGDGSLSEAEGIWGTEGISGTGGSSGTEELLYRVLNDRHFTVPKAFTIRAEALCTAEIAIYTSGEGRRQAISDLLEIAEAMETPGELFYVDSEQTGWLLEDTAYAREWVVRMVRLLDRGFVFKAALHFSVSVDKFVAFFQLCSPLIFHRNARWYYHQYYDENIYWFSFFILEHAMSIAGMSMSPEQTSATVYTDAYSILQHRNVVEMVLTSCRPMFSDLSMGLGAEAARMLREQGRAGETLFSYLPAPAFMSAGEQLFDDILRDNEITGAAASRLREINRQLRGLVENQLTGGQGEFIQILQLGEMEHRADTCFISTSLSLLGKRKVVVSPAHYARGLRELALRLEAFPSYRLFLAADADDIRLPAMNCWCRGTSWMVQMDCEGFRLCREPTLCGAAYTTLEQGWRRVPPGRKDPAAVRAVLERLIERLEK